MTESNYSLDAFRKKEIDGKIIKIEQGVVKDFVQDAFIHRFDEPDKPVVNFTIEMDYTIFEEFQTWPSFQGFQQSNLKKILDKNPHLLAQGIESIEDWEGQPIKVTMGSKGYLEIAK